MTDPLNPTPARGPDGNPQTGPKRGRRWLLVTTVALAAGLTGAVASRAMSQDGPPWHGGFMGGPMHGGFRGGPFHGPLDPAQAADRADRMVRHLAVEIDASTEQQDKLRAIAKAAVNDLLPMRDKAIANRDKARGLLTASTIDRTAIEAFRAQQVALADEASRRVAKALADAAEVLTPEQRRKIDERIEWRRNHWRPWSRG